MKSIFTGASFAENLRSSKSRRDFRPHDPSLRILQLCAHQDEM